MKGDIDERYAFFWSGPLSQWQRSDFTLDGIAFCTAEQAMMYLKARLFGDDVAAARMLETEDPGGQKALGRQVRGFDAEVWDAEKRVIVRRVNEAKFTQNKGLRRKLFQTGDRLLVEASPTDTIWGIGLDEAAARRTDPALWPGQNLLGRILTDLRDDLRQKFPEETTAN